jgi:hypothetical protein
MRKFSTLSLSAIFVFLAVGSARCEEPVKVTVCQLQKDPPAYNQKLVEVEAFVTQGFENFSLFDPECNIYPGIWLEYGGKINSGTIYLGAGSSDRQRPKELVVQNIAIPLVDDDLFHRFDERIHLKGPRDHGPVTHAKLVGRFFSGRKEIYPNGESSWGGFGHFGCCTLLAIQQVKDANFEEHPGLDSWSVPEPLIPGYSPKNNLWHNLTPNDISKYILESQRKTEEGSHSWAFDDPRRVAIDLIKIDRGGKSVETSLLHETIKRYGLIEFELVQPEDRMKYSVIVSRPSWLTFYARDPNKIAWVVVWGMAEKIRAKKQQSVK